MPANSTEWISLAKDIVLAGVPVATVWIAYLGLGTWRDELHGKAGFDTARQMIRAAYKLRERIKDSRSPMIRPHEFPEDYNAQLSASSVDDYRAWGQVYAKRMRPVSEAVEEFDAHTLEAEALWGAPIREKADVLRECVVDLYGAVEAVLDDKASGGENFKSDPQFAKAMRSTAHGSRGDTSSTFSQKLAAALAGIEDELRPHLRRPGS